MAKARKNAAAPVKRGPRKSKLLAANDELAKKECIQTVLTLHIGQTTTISQIVDEARKLYDYIKGTDLPDYTPKPESEATGIAPFAGYTVVAAEDEPKVNHRSKFEETHTL